MVFDVKNLRILASTPIDTADDGSVSPNSMGCKFARGITCVDNYIVIGTHTGDLLLFTCTGEGSFNVKTSVPEHKAPIADLTTCIYDLITLSADVLGNIICWNKNMKTVIKRISTGQSISVINILRKQAICGTHSGQMFLYSIQSGALLAEVNVHFRQITAISVAPESAYIMTASEDGYIRMWKLHSRKPENYQIEYRYAEKTDDNIIVGAQFLNGRGSGYVLAQFEYNKLPIFIIKRPGPTAPAAK
jgi:WD40 repeat protein